jgi:glycosyltransferase involved in cell wall biosynthesis
MNRLRIALSTQTPLVRFVSDARSVAVASGRQLTSAQLRENVDYQLTPGGVCRMLLPSVHEWHRTGWLKEAHWFSLQPNGPRELGWDGLPLTLHHLKLVEDELGAYARTKEKLWADIHGIDSPRFDTEDFRFYSRYNWSTYDSLMATTPDLDVAYIHDFQTLQVGGLIGLSAPTVFRWHVPFDPARIPRYTRNFLVRSMEAFDIVIVSTRRDLEGLLRARFQGLARQLYPHIDRRDWPDVTREALQRFEQKVGLRADDELILLVARMDPMKRQDLAVRAIARLARKHPRAKLVLVGNGSFSGSANGGLALTKPAVWRQRLAALVQELGLEDRVVFAHYLSNGDLAAGYSRADVVVLPSDIEGFGLTVLEAWRYGKPVVVSRGCGVAEIVHDGVNGYVFPSGDDARLAERLDQLLSDHELREALGHSGRLMGRAHYVDEAAPREAEVLQEAIDRYGEG